MKPTRTKLWQRFNAWLDGHKAFRDQLVSFGFSCCLHVAILLVLSLIAISSGALPSSLLLVAAPEEAAEDSRVVTESELALAPDMPEAVEVDRPVEFDLVDLEASPPQLTMVSDTSKAEPIETTAEQTAKPESGHGRASALDGMQSLAAAGIQSRVTKAGGKKGEVQFALAWRDINDVDLHVIAPSGEHIAYLHRRSRCGGMLDVDMNVEGESEEPVENVRWLRNAPWGRYTVLINFFRLNNDGLHRPQRSSPYQLLAQIGPESFVREATAGFGEQQVTVWRFIYVPSTYSTFDRDRLLREVEQLQAREESMAAPMLQQAQEARGSTRQRLLQALVQEYPHTDAAIEALQLMDGEVVKRSGN